MQLTGRTASAVRTSPLSAAIALVGRCPQVQSVRHRGINVDFIACTAGRTELVSPVDPLRAGERALVVANGDVAHVRPSDAGAGGVPGSVGSDLPGEGGYHVRIPCDGLPRRSIQQIDRYVARDVDATRVRGPGVLDRHRIARVIAVVCGRRIIPSIAAFICERRAPIQEPQPLPAPSSSSSGC